MIYSAGHGLLPGNTVTINPVKSGWINMALKRKLLKRRLNRKDRNALKLAGRKERPPAMYFIRSVEHMTFEVR